MGLRKYGQIALLILAAALGCWAFLRFLLPVLLPFGLGLLAARSAQPACQALQKRLHLPRWLAIFLCITVTYALLFLLLWLAGSLLARELGVLLRALPELTASLAQPAGRLRALLLQLADRFPDGVGAALKTGIDAFFTNGAGLPERLYDWVFTFASGLIRRLPDFFLFLLTALLSGFLLSGELPRLRSLWQSRVPPVWQEKLLLLRDRARAALGGWFHAQARLMGITFLILLAGFLLLGVRSPLLTAMAVALLDALPALGSGTILLPWSLLLLLRGQSARAIGMAGLYAAASLTRTTLEPRLLGQQIGLSPLVTLLALYAGFRFLGLPGMILFPLLAMLIRQFTASPGKNPA